MIWEYKELLDKVKNFDRIVVTGPQRSGTTIISKCFAKDLGYRFINEADFGTYDFDGAYETLKSHEKIVVQCPALSHYCHYFSNIESCCVIWVKRDINEILDSHRTKKFISMTYDINEIETYKNSFDNIDFNQFDNMWEMKHFIWDNYQSFLTKNSFELEYSSLSDHPDWIDFEDRKWDRLKITKN